MVSFLFLETESLQSADFSLLAANSLIRLLKNMGYSRGFVWERAGS